MIPRTFVLSLVALVLWCAVAVAQDTGTIVGEVVDRETSRPIAGAQVHLPGSSIGTVTDDAGRYRIAAAPVGSTVLQAELQGPAEQVVP